MKQWFIQFFGYFEDINGHLAPFTDGMGEGAFGWRHLLWIIFVIIAAIGGHAYFKSRPNKEKKVITFLLICLFAVRLINQTVRATIGAEVPWTRAFPFHMCTVLTFLLPLTYLLNLKAIQVPVYVLSMMGGVITLLIGDYFESSFLTFSNFEGMSAHTILILVPIFEIASGHFQLKLSESWQVIVGILILMGWATLANELFFVNEDPNYMYLRKNALPFGNQSNFFFYYCLIFIAFFLSIYSIPIYKTIAQKNGDVINK